MGITWRACRWSLQPEENTDVPPTGQAGLHGRRGEPLSRQYWLGRITPKGTLRSKTVPEPNRANPNHPKS